METVPFFSSANLAAGGASAPVAAVSPPPAGEDSAVVATVPPAGAAEREQPADAPVAQQPAPPPDPCVEQFRRSLRRQHDRVREFLEAQRERWQRIETELGRQIEGLQAELESLRGQTLQGPAGARRDREVELQEQLLRLPSGLHAAACPAADAGKDWESEKRRILATLESDPGQNDSPTDDERLKLDDLVGRTDELVAEKNQEIEHLRRLLQSQSDNVGSIVAGAAAGQQLLDQDAVIRQEREHLVQLQREWREKLAQAEIEISLERAKIARKHAEIDEKLRMLEMRARTREGPAEALCSTGRPARGRWLARLGLSDPEAGSPERP
ncbi:MAG: hypothetical protein ABSF26_03140 [Thermoguttaceae bacterium]|jgi:chromosome segregation ATPase